MCRQWPSSVPGCRTVCGDRLGPQPPMTSRSASGIGQARYFHRWPRNPLVLLVRRLSVGRSLATLAPRQPPSGGFLESASWTSFLLMGLASTGRVDHPLARRALGFLLDTVRDDASWPNVSNQSVGQHGLRGQRPGVSQWRCRRAGLSRLAVELPAKRNRPAARRTLRWLGKYRRPRLVARTYIPRPQRSGRFRFC